MYEKFSSWTINSTQTNRTNQCNNDIGPFEGETNHVIRKAEEIKIHKRKIDFS